MLARDLTLEALPFGGLALVISYMFAVVLVEFVRLLESIPDGVEHILALMHGDLAKIRLILRRGKGTRIERILHEHIASASGTSDGVRSTNIGKISGGLAPPSSHRAIRRLRAEADTGQA